MAIKELEELNEIKKQFGELMTKAEEIVKKNEKGDERWRAEGRGRYWFIGFEFEVMGDIDYGGDIDYRWWKACNYFQTKEEAEKVAQHFKDYLILRADAKGFVPKDASAGFNYYYVFWEATYEYLRICADGGFLSGTIYFETREDAEASIEKHKDIWKRYLGVEE